MPVPDAVLLIVMGGTDARIQFESDASGRTDCMHTVNPSGGKFGKRRQIAVGDKPACFKASHLADARRSPCAA